MVRQKLQRWEVVGKISRQLQRIWEDRLWEKLGSGSRKKTASRVIPENCQTFQSVAKRSFYKHFSIINLNFLYQSFVAVSGNLGGEFPVVDDALLSHEQETYSTTSLDENCIEFEVQIYRSYYVDLRQTFYFSNWNLSRVVATKLTIPKKNKEEHKEQGKADEEQTAEKDQEAPVPLVTHVNNI